MQLLTTVMPDDTPISFGPGDGGTLDNPIPRGPNFGTFDAPEGNGIFIVGTGGAYHDVGRRHDSLLQFKELRIRGGEHVPMTDSRPDHVNGGTILMPDDDALRGPTSSQWMLQSNKYYTIRGGDVLWIPFHLRGLGLPSDDTCDAWNAIIREVTEWGELDHWPRMRHCMSLFGWGRDYNAPNLEARTPGGQRDVGWLVENHRIRTGGRDQVGYLAQFSPKWGEGHVNGQYGSILYHAMQFCQTRRPEDWYFFLGQSLVHAMQGRAHSGKYKGMSHYTKGIGLPGDYFEPRWSKQWGMNLIAAWVLTDKHPVFDLFVQEYREALKSWWLSDVWTGAWGSRIMARFLEDVLLMWTLFKDPELEAILKAAVGYNVAIVDPNDSYWENHSDRRYPASPWMNAQLARVLWKIGKAVGWKDGERDKVLEIMKAIMTRGTTTINGFPATRYRMDGNNIDPGHPALGAFMIPMVRALHEAGVPADQYANSSLLAWKDLVFGRWGCHWADIDNVPPIQEVGIEYHRQGVGGWGKVCRYIGQGFVV